MGLINIIKTLSTILYPVSLINFSDIKIIGNAENETQGSWVRELAEKHERYLCDMWPKIVCILYFKL